jgi:carboxylesterase type B
MTGRYTADMTIASVLFHLHSAEPLFKRCISMSGTPIMLQALSQEVVETSYTSIIREFGLEGASAEERINALRTAFPEELVSKTPLTIPLLPYLNGDIIPERATFATLAAKDHANLPGMQWCDQLMIGDCQHDGTVFHFQGLAQRKAGIAGTITSSFYTHLAPAAAHAVLEAYNITPSTPDNEAMQRIFDLATDIAYAVPALTYTRSFQGKTYAYHFNELNPWDGAFKGKSTHMLDVAFLFQHYNEYMAPKAQEVAKAIATDFIRFVNGVQPWAEFDEGERKVRTYGPSEKKVIGAVDENGWGNDRRDVLWKMSEKGEVDLDDLMSAWNIFIAGN